MTNNTLKTITSIAVISILNTGYALADIIIEPEESANPINQIIEFSSSHSMEVGLAIVFIIIVITDFMVLRHIRKKKANKDKTNSSDNTES